MSRLATYLKNLLLVVLLISFIRPLIRGIWGQYSSLVEHKTKIGVVEIDGTIANGSAYVPHLRNFFKDPEIKGLVLKIDSPGGSSGSAQAVFQEISDLKKQYNKPIIAFCENICTSAAYYIACATDYIITQPSTLVGNIGVYLAYPNFQDLLKQLQVKYTVIETGDYKTGGLYFKDLTPAQQAMYQSITDDTYKQFVYDVSQRRPKVASKDPKEWADGKTFTGKQGLEIGLVDDLGAQALLEKALRDRIAVEGDIEWVHIPKPSMFSKLFGTEENNNGETFMAAIGSKLMNTFFALKPVQL